MAILGWVSKQAGEKIVAGSVAKETGELMSAIELSLANFGVE